MPQKETRVMELGYARVSTTHQDLRRQLDALAAEGISSERIWQDKKTGATVDRPGFAELRRYARAGDTIVATNLDRIGRNLRECLNLLHELREHGVGIKTLRDPVPIDTSNDSPMAHIAVAMLALFAEMERTFARERAAHARTVALNSGKLPGRPRKLDIRKLQAARASLDAGMHPNDVADTLNIHRATLYRALRRDQTTTR
jgi:DNA invertase Pin-like site-specific DNA recombinase